MKLPGSSRMRVLKFLLERAKGRCTCDSHEMPRMTKIKREEEPQGYKKIEQMCRSVPVCTKLAVRLPATALRLRPSSRAPTMRLRSPQAPTPLHVPLCLCSANPSATGSWCGCQQVARGCHQTGAEPPNTLLRGLVGTMLFQSLTPSYTYF